MISRTTAMWTLLAVATPCPLSMLFCNGLLPPAVVLAVIANYVATVPWFMTGSLALEVALLLWLLRWIAKRLVGTMSGRALAAIASLLVGLYGRPYIDVVQRPGHVSSGGHRRAAVW